jgi:threonine synthase
MKYKYQCSDCGAEYDSTEVRYLCPQCSASNSPDKPPKGVLKCIFDYSGIAAGGLDHLIENHFFDLYPIDDSQNLPQLRTGHTPLYEYPYIVNDKSPVRLFIKDDSQNPTFSFKDRASAMVSAYAKENAIDTIVAASTGNAGSSIAGIAAAQGQKAIVMVPGSAPIAKLVQIALYGATIIPVEGNYDDAFELSLQATARFGWYNRNTAFNPLTIEGKKTVVFELIQQMGFEIPDYIFVPVGDGAIISGIYKGFEELLVLGLIEKIPKIIAVQSEGSANIVNNRFKKNPVFDSGDTIADSISVDIPRNFYMTVNYLFRYAGDGITVKEKDIPEAIRELASNFGLFAEPAAATAFAGMKRYIVENDIGEYDKCLVLLTGSGLKDVKTAQSVVQIPEPIVPDVNLLEKYG